MCLTSKTPSQYTCHVNRHLDIARKSLLDMPMLTDGRREYSSNLFRTLGARMGWMVSMTLRPLYSRVHTRCTMYCAGGWVGLGARLDGNGNASHPTGIRSPDRPAGMESVDRRGYPGRL
jgi:hypothetical protein